MKFTEHTLLAPLPEDLQRLKGYGDFPVMERVIQRKLNKELPRHLRERLLAELEIIRRLPVQYPYSWETALKMMTENICAFTRKEFQELWEEDAMEWIYVQGNVHFHVHFFSNLIKTREGLRCRLLDPEQGEDTRENSEFLNKTIALMKEQGGISRRFSIKTVLHLNEEAQRPGERIRVYLPIPVEYAQVKQVRLLHAQVVFASGEQKDVPVFRIRSGDEPEKREEEGSSFIAWIAPEDAGQRTVCFCGEYQKGMSFQIEYTYQVEMPWFDLKYPQKSLRKGLALQDEVNRPTHYLSEELPHVRFTPYLKALAEEIVDGENDALRKAKKIYDFITTHLMYSFVREYFCITDLVHYTACGWKGDCGLQALLFITLCRISGVPARWQSGLYTRPGHVGCHDWAMFYIEEYGWLFADCSFGGSAARMGCEERREFYFGNLDPYRMPSCSQFQADFLPPVKGMRIDPYDNQLGEVEYADGCLRAGEFETVHELTAVE